MATYCPPPPDEEIPGLWFDVHEKVVDHVLPSGFDTFNADLGPFQDPFDGPLTDFFDYSNNTLRQTKTLTLIGPVPITISWTHHIIVSDPFSHDTSEDSITLTLDSPEYTWPTGTETAEGSEYDDSFVAHRAA